MSKEPPSGSVGVGPTAPQFDRSSTVVITGGSGFLAERLARRLREEVPVILFGRKPPSSPDLRALWTQDGMVDLVSSAARIRSVEAGVIVNCAAVLSPPVDLDDNAVLREINGRWPQLLAQIATSGHETRLIHISTDAVFDGQLGGYSEMDECKPASAYGESKRLGELGVLASDSNALVVRTNFIGWNPRHRGFANGILDSIRESRPYLGYDDYFTSSMHVKDLCEVLRNLTTSQATGVLHVASRDSASKADQAERLIELLDSRGVVFHRVSAPQREDRPSGRYDLSLNVDRARTEWALELPTIEETLRATARELRSIMEDVMHERSNGNAL